MKSAFIAMEQAMEGSHRKDPGIAGAIQACKRDRYGQDFQYRIVERLGTWQYA